MHGDSRAAEPPPVVAGKVGDGHLTVQHRRVPSVHGPKDRRESAAWYEEDHGEWRVAYRLVAQADAMVITEVRIFPVELADRRAPGEWSHDDAAVPPAGLTDAVLKALRTELPVERAREAFAHLTGRACLSTTPRSTSASRLTIQSLSFVAPLSHGRNGQRPHRRDDRPLVELAAAYARHVEQGHPAPVQAAAADCHYTPKYASNRLGDARERGYLTQAPRGKAGGSLTAEAIRMLGG